MTRWIDHYGLGTFSDHDHTFAGVVAHDLVLEIPANALTDGPATVLGVLDNWAEARTQLPGLAQSALSGGAPLAELCVRPPVQPRQIFQAGANYRSHVAEIIVSGKAGDDNRTDEQLRAAAEKMLDERAATGSAFLFAGLPSAMCGADDEVILIADSTQTDWEAELTVVIGSVTDNVAPDDALSHVAGYTIANDISARDLQFPAEHRPLGGDWLRAKNRPTFLPVGPFIVPADVVGDYRDLELTLDLNGKRMQQDKAANMIFDVPALVAQASQITPLQPGDLILTGSPAGNGGKWQRWLRPGDVLETQISGLSSLRNTCR
ncbi:fumarylacetoacetate hydrolase family protein [Gordonia sp. SL306]|uniref:fumarylacetoacetate hydrolase family protein n=1 Tax=unclassified Gordonia (in: high G+C Gram-positive bacteria) TaxID=2657482 RepID=UPI0022706698|nr:fumarylacetoacetate hydrolase family protein [Gordonia sp. SL306]WAC57163.1 fumarylacetoacetate hydrolase family protein [Gordonia sp. SL306]